MYNCSKWPVPLQLNVTLLLPGISWLRNMLLLASLAHCTQPPTVFSVTGDLEPSLLSWSSSDSLLVVSSSLSPPHPSAAPSSIYMSPGRHVEETRFTSSNAWQREHSKDGISTYPWESFVIGEGSVGVWHCSDEYTKLHKKEVGARKAILYHVLDPHIRLGNSSVSARGRGGILDKKKEREKVKEKKKDPQRHISV